MVNSSLMILTLNIGLSMKGFMQICSFMKASFIFSCMAFFLLGKVCYFLCIANTG